MGRCRVDVGWMWGGCRVVIVFPPSPPNVGFKLGISQNRK